jgi:hypothetical protein
MRRSTKERAKKLLEEMKPLVWTGTFKEICHRLPELLDDEELNTFDPLAAYGSGGAIAATYGGVERLPPTGPQCMYCGGLNGDHKDDCQREKGE